MSAKENPPEEKSLVAFQFEGKQIRTATKDDDASVWFAAKDVAAALDISWSGKTLGIIPKEWKTMIKFITDQGKRELIFISEPAVYRLAFRSNKPEAEKFTNWVAAEVLPAIRRTGAYSQPASNLAPAVLDTEILKTLLSTSQALEALHGKMKVMTAVADSLAHLDDMARAITNSVSQLSQMSNVETSIIRHINLIRDDYKKVSERDYQRNQADFLNNAAINQELGRIGNKLKDIELKIDSEETCRKGIFGYLEKYLPQHEVADVNTTSNINKENNPEHFINECCTNDAFACTELTFLYKVYKAWAYARFSQALGPLVFWDYLRDRLPKYVSVKVIKSKKVLCGIKPVSTMLED